MISLIEHLTFDENHDSVTGNTEEEGYAAKNSTNDADVNAEANEIIHEYKEKVFTIE